MTHLAHSHIFISHSSKDDWFVMHLRRALEGLGLSVWVDSRQLRSGEKLPSKIEKAIEDARQVIAVLSRDTVESPWVRREIEKALKVERLSKDSSYRVIPLLVGIGPGALQNWFPDEPLAIPIKLDDPFALSEVLPDLLAALGERLPNDHEQPVIIVESRIEELLLKLDDITFETTDDKSCATATAQLVYQPADQTSTAIESKKFTFIKPIDLVQEEELRWYLEDYWIWPIGIFKERAERVEAQLSQWGQSLYAAVFKPVVDEEAYMAWCQAGVNRDRRLSIFVDKNLPDRAKPDERTMATEAAAQLLSLPWELLHDGQDFLVQERHPVSVRRRLPKRHSQHVRPKQLPVRILLVSPRPEVTSTKYFDHRSSAMPLIQAVEELGELVNVVILRPPTFDALEKALDQAESDGKQFDVIHFDGHGVWDPIAGTGALCFEDPNDLDKLYERGTQLVHPQKLANAVKHHRIPMIFLDACQTAKILSDPTASLASRLLDEGARSVVAMSYSVLIGTAQRFVQSFYRDLARGRRVGSAMIRAQLELYRDPDRGEIFGAGKLQLMDWFVPVLYQEADDPQLVTRLPSGDVRYLETQRRRLSLGALPVVRLHNFVGRSRQLLAVERILNAKSYAVILGRPGEGKTALAVELVHWLIRTGRFLRAAFVNLVQCTDPRAVVDSLSKQLLTPAEQSILAEDPALESALQHIERALKDSSTIILMDEIEDVFSAAPDGVRLDSQPTQELSKLFLRLLNANPTTRLLFTTREPLPEPFSDKANGIDLNALEPAEAALLVSEVMKSVRSFPKPDELEHHYDNVYALIDAVGCHAHALVLLTHELIIKGRKITSETIRNAMAKLHSKSPDDREKSLYASIEPALQKLPALVRQWIKILAVFHVGAQGDVMTHMARGDRALVNQMGIHLIRVGLADPFPYGHLRLHPALPSYLFRELRPEHQEELFSLWVEGMKGLISYLSDTFLPQEYDGAVQLIRMESANLIALLEWSQQNDEPQVIVSLATRLEFLFAAAHSPLLLQRVSSVREEVMANLTEWTPEKFFAELAMIDRLVERGENDKAYFSARELLRKSMEAGEEAYDRASYDIALAHINVGKVLHLMRAPEYALTSLHEGTRRMEEIAKAGFVNAAIMASTAISHIGDCLLSLGEWDQAAEAYQDSINRESKFNNQRNLAVNKAQLGVVQRMQDKYAAALKSIEDARNIFENLSDWRSAAKAWGQIGDVHVDAEEFPLAERAYRASLAISVQEEIPAAESQALSDLGSLYSKTGRLQEAAICYRQAAEVSSHLARDMGTAMILDKFADILIKLGEVDEARSVLHRSVESKQAYGWVAEPWETWDLLHQLEQTSCNAEAAKQARQQAINTFMAYRMADGQKKTMGLQLCIWASEAIQNNKVDQAVEVFAQSRESSDVLLVHRPLFFKLEAVLLGDRNLDLADDPDLYYEDAVELRLFLEALGSK